VARETAREKRARIIAKMVGIPAATAMKVMDLDRGKRSTVKVRIGPKRFRGKDAPRGVGSVGVKELDTLCRAVVFARDGNRCRKCGSTVRLAWCHVFSRRYRSVRWDLDNSFCGCAACHLWWHHQPLNASAWWIGEIGESRYSSLRMRMNRGGRRPSMAGVRLYLIAEQKKLVA